MWFQNARAKYRRNLLKQQDSEPGSQGKGQGDPGSPGGEGQGELKDEDMMQGSPALSDISSTPSLSDLHSQTLETDHNSSSNTSMSDLFSSTLAAIN